MNHKHIRYLSWVILAFIPLMAAGLTARTVQMVLADDLADGEGAGGEVLMPTTFSPSGSVSTTASYSFSYEDGGAEPSSPVAAFVEPAAPAPPATPADPPRPAGSSGSRYPSTGGPSSIEPFPAPASEAVSVNSLATRYQQLYEAERFEELRPVAAWAEEIAPRHPLTAKMLRQEKLAPGDLSWRGVQEVAQAIATALKESGQLSDYDVNIKYELGVCKLAGRVTTPQQKVVAEAIVRKVPEVQSVQNELTVGPKAIKVPPLSTGRSIGEALPAAPAAPVPSPQFPPRGAVPAKNPAWKANLAVAQIAADKSDRFILAYFHGAWSGPCRQMDVETFADDALIEYLEKTFVCLRIDTDEMTSAPLAFKIKSWPTTLILSAKGEELERLEGSRSPEVFRKTMAEKLAVAEKKAGKKPQQDATVDQVEGNDGADALIGGSGQDSILPTVPAGKGGSPDEEAQRLLDEAAKKLAGYDWVRAGIRQRVDLFGKRLDGTGTYLKGPNWKMKLELKIALDDRRPPSSLQQVCDGRWLWDYRDVLGNRILTKVDVTAVRDVLEKAPAGAGRPPSASILGLGGLDQLLRGLRAQFDFTTAGPIKVGERTFTALRGRWKRDVLVRMLPEQKADLEAGEPANLKKLPEYVPDEVLLLLDPKTLFVHRVEYRRSDTEKKDDEKDDGKSGDKKSKLSGKALVIMELFDVEVNQPVDELNFLYKSDLPAMDRTEEYLKMLKGEK